MAAPADQASESPEQPTAQPASKQDEAVISVKSEQSAVESAAAWTEVQSAMRLADEAVSSAVQGMADVNHSSDDSNHK